VANIAVLYCKRVKDHSCIACAKCFKAIAEKDGEYGRFDEIELVGMTDCGDCPGLTVPRMKLLTEVTTNLNKPIDVVYFGTCIKLAMETGQCPIDFDQMKVIIEKKFGCEVVLGTHNY
jgi:predicted metal-binding protein